MKKQRGQVIVEFALILPLFLFLIFGLIYSGMLFHDYSTLSNVARSATREAAIATTTTTDADALIIKNYYEDGKFKGGTLTTLYVPYKPSGASGPFEIIRNTDGKDIVTTIHLRLNVNLPFIDKVIPQNFDIVYHMRKDS